MALNRTRSKLLQKFVPERKSDEECEYGNDEEGIDWPRPEYSPEELLEDYTYEEERALFDIIDAREARRLAVGS